MKPSDIYESAVIKTETDLWRWVEFFPELGSFWDVDIDDNEKVKVKTHLSKLADWGERSLSVRSVWYNDKPFMVIYSAGRGERDEERCCVTSARRYRKAVTYLLSIAPISLDPPEDPRKDQPYLDNLYGYRLTVGDDGKMVAEKNEEG